MSADVPGNETFKCDTLSDLKLLYLVSRDMYPRSFIAVDSTAAPFRLHINHDKQFEELDTSFLNTVPNDDFKKRKARETWKLARIAGEMITSNCFEAPNDLTFEKIFSVFFQFRKKHYMGKMFEFDDKNPDKIPEKFKIDKKGIVLKRRDNVPIIRKIFKACSDTLIDEGEEGVEKAKGIFRKHIADILNGTADMADFTLSKEMKHNYAKTSRCDKHPTKLFRKSKCEFNHTQAQMKSKKCVSDCKKPNCKECKELVACGKIIENCTECKVSVPHVVLAEKIKQRSPGDAPGEGDRIPFVYVDIGNMTAKQFERVEDPQYAKENNLKLDLVYYYEHQIKKPMERLFGLLVDNPTSVCADLIATYVEQVLTKNYDQKVPKSIRDYLPNDEQEKKKKHDRDLMTQERKKKKLEQAQGSNSKIDKFVVVAKRNIVEDQEFGILPPPKRNKKTSDADRKKLQSIIDGIETKQTII